MGRPLLACVLILAVGLAPAGQMRLPVAARIARPGPYLSHMMQAVAAEPGLQGIFLRVDKASGGCSVHGFHGWCDVVSYTQSIASSWFLNPTPIQKTVADIGPLTAIRRPDIASPCLYICACTAIPTSRPNRES